MTSPPALLVTRTRLSPAHLLVVITETWPGWLARTGWPHGAAMSVPVRLRLKLRRSETDLLGGEGVEDVGCADLALHRVVEGTVVAA